MAYLPEIRFSNRRGPSRHRNPREGLANLDYYGSRGDGDNPQFVPNGLDPFQILRDAFQRYIVQTPIESNTISIRITFLANENDTEAQSMNIIRRVQSPDDRIQARVTSDSISSEDIENPENVFQNNQLDEVITQLQGFHSIMMITLCEIYNDSLRERERYGTYYVPIRVLYRNVPEEWVEMTRELNNTREQQRLLEYEQRLLEYEQNEQQDQAQRLEQFTNQTEEGQQAILNDPFFAQNPFDDAAGNEGDNPNPLQVVNSQAILNMPLTSFVWPGMCTICLDSNPTESGGLCRVNCSVGHIFHCDCINGYRNTRTIYGWNNKCPVCRTNINKYVNFPSNRNNELPSEFGRKRIKINSEMKYLKSLI
jgi:hypothetical protein